VRKDTMKLRETKILDLLREKPGRFIQHDMGKYTMKEANGSDVVVTENGKAEAVLPEHIHMDPLTDTGKLRIDGSRYYLAT
jgi:hypothetical protein